MHKWESYQLNRLRSDKVIVTNHVGQGRIVVNLDHSFGTCRSDHPLLTTKYGTCYQILSSGLLAVLQYPKGTTRKVIEQCAERIFEHYENR